MAVVTAVFGIFSCIACFVLCPEYTEEELAAFGGYDVEQAKENVPIGTFLKSVLKNKYLVMYTIINFLYMMILMSSFGVGQYYFQYVFGNLATFSIVMAMSALMLPIYIFIPKICKKFGVASVISGTMMIACVGVIIRLFAPALLPAQCIGYLCVSLPNIFVACVGSHGYTGFYVDLTDKLRIGEDNEIKVVADNTQTPNSRWYSGSGIYRNVNLLVGDKRHVKLDGVKVVTERIHPAVISVQTEVDDVHADGFHGDGSHDAGLNQETAFADLDVKVEVYEYHKGFDTTGKIKALEDGDVPVATGSGTDCRIEMGDAALWNEEFPNLYQVRVMLMEGEKLVDEQSVVTGIRTLEWNAEKGMVVNGKSVKLRGGCIHHDNGILGACAPYAAEYRKAKILKRAGFNAIRSAHNPIGKEMLAACDELGIYVMDEAFDQWQFPKLDYDYALYFDKEWEKDCLAMILKDRNHPSVIMYSIGNEIGDTGKASGKEISHRLSRFFHKHDATRPTTNGINPTVSAMGGTPGAKNVTESDVVNPYEESAGSQATASLLANMIATVAPFISKLLGKPKKVEKLLKPCFDELDIVGYNYAEQCYEPHHEWAPKRIMVGSETYPQSVAERWPMIMRSPYVIGDFMWTAMDYLGEAGIGVPIYGKSRGGFNRPYPCVSGGCGAIDLIGHVDTEGYHAAIAWGWYKKPYIAVRPLNHVGEKYFFGMWRGTDAVASWSWIGMDGRMAEIEVYSEGKSVELLALQSRDIVRWQVRLTDENGKEGKWSEEAVFEMGLLEAKDWKAKWVMGGYDHDKDAKVRYSVDCFKKEFHLKGEVEKARLYATACGMYEVRINGRKAGGWVLAPGSTAFQKRVHYQTYDVTELLGIGGQGQHSENQPGSRARQKGQERQESWERRADEARQVLTIELADGFYASRQGVFGKAKPYGYEPKVCAQLEILYANGTVEVIGTDETFSWSNDGAIRQSDLKDGEIVDYNFEPSYSRHALGTAYEGIVCASNSVPVQEMEHFSNPRVIHCPDGNTVLDFGQNIAGYMEAALQGPKGHKCSMVLGERLNEDGNFSYTNISWEGEYTTCHFQTNDVICDGARHTYKPKFTVMGFQYVLLLDWPEEVVAENFTAIAVYSKMNETFTFSSSEGGAGWGDAMILIPYYYWKRYGDDALICEFWEEMERCFAFYKRRMGKRNLLSLFHPKRSKYDKYLCACGRDFGEWTEPDDCAPPKSKMMIPMAEEATAYLAYTANLMRKMASHFGKAEEAKIYKEVAVNTTKAYNYYFVKGGDISTNRMCKYVRPCGLGLAQGKSREKLLQKIVDLNREREYKIGTGFLTTPFVFEMLSEAGVLDAGHYEIECAGR